MGLVDDIKDSAKLLMSGDRLTTSQKAFISVQLAAVVLVVVFMIILVFLPSIYNINAAGVWMARLALASVILIPVMNSVMPGMVAEIAQKKRELGL